MNNRLVKVCEDILNDENEFKKFFGIKTLGEIYDYLKNKVPDLSSDEFGYFVAKVLEEYEKQKGNSNVIDLEKLEKIAGGKGFGKRLASGGLALASLLTSQPSLYAAEADKAAQSTDSYLSGKDLGDKDSTDRSERSGGNSSSALGYVASFLGGAVVTAAAAAGVAYKFGSVDISYLELNDFEKRAVSGDMTWFSMESGGDAYRFFNSDIDPSDINTYARGLALALAYGKYDFFGKFIQEINKTASSRGEMGLGYYYYQMFIFACQRSDNYCRLALRNLILHYTKELSCYISSEVEPKDAAKAVKLLIDCSQWDLLKVVFDAGLVDPRYCLKDVMGSKSISVTWRQFINRFMANEQIEDDIGLFKELRSSIDKESLDKFLNLVVLNDRVLKWKFDLDGYRSEGSNGLSLLGYLFYTGKFNFVDVITNVELIPHWFYDDKSVGDDFFKFAEDKIDRKTGFGLKDGVNNDEAKVWYCKLWDKAVKQGMSYKDPKLTPETLGYRQPHSVNP